MIEFKNLTKSFEGRAVLKGISTSVKPGEILFILGKSGVGKSVLLKCLVGLMKPDSGEIRIDGKEITGLKEEEWGDIRKKCGLIFQFPALLDSLTVFDNIAFGLNSFTHLPSEEREAKVYRQAERVKLKRETLNRMPFELSFGTQKRVSIARTLAVDPQILLFDEPTTGMDPVITQTLNELISSLARDLKVTAVVVSHDLKSAFKIADRIVLLDQGQIVFDGIPSEFRKTEEPLAKQFLKGI